jgi:beta-mannosidase
LLEDAYYRENEALAGSVAEYDYIYEKEFSLGDAFLSMKKIELLCEGIDTVADISINGFLIAHTENMHRTYEFDVKALLRIGENKIQVKLYSPLEYIRSKGALNNGTWGTTTSSIEGFQHIRKAHCMFGWDWGPKIPDLGIWRGVSLRGYSGARLRDMRVFQKHADGSVELTIRVKIDNLTGRQFTAETSLTAPDGQRTCVREAMDACADIRIHIDAPALWWPNGYGGQPLYHLRLSLTDQGVELDSREYDIGLRTLTVRREKDPWGSSFEFRVNGVSIFAMGADYIPEDAVLSRCSRERTAQLIRDCADANFNCLRVWGGGYYPEDWFYDLCDRYGLIIWQDMLFACATYEMSEQFANEIVCETRDNIRRIRHHACLGLWCGNNEMEWGWLDWSFPKPAHLRADYLKQFEVILAQVAKQEHPEAFYWPSSPSSGGGFDDPNGENHGDSHYWAVWHGSKPFSDYRNHYHRFMSEFGFQSLPSCKTIESFTLPEDRNLTSAVMENHEKQADGYAKIMVYITQMLPFPCGMEQLVYASQVLQAEAIRQGVEHWRRNRGRCMGAIYWQLNDNWPVASWASIDYFGRWKALHYAARRFFAPVLVSAVVNGRIVDLHITNESRNDFEGLLEWKLRNNGTAVIREGATPVSVKGLSSVDACEALDFSEILKDDTGLRSHYLEYSLTAGGEPVSSGTALFVQPKHFLFLDPRIVASVQDCGDRFGITLRSAKSVELDTAGFDARFSDNFFDLSAGEARRITVRKDAITRKDVSCEELNGALIVRSMYWLGKEKER